MLPCVLLRSAPQMMLWMLLWACWTALESKRQWSLGTHMVRLWHLCIGVVAATVVCVLLSYTLAHMLYCLTTAAITQCYAGTFVAGRLARLHRKRVHNLCLIDPVCFGMFMPHLLSNFLYTAPKWRGLHQCVAAAAASVPPDRSLLPCLRCMQSTDSC